MPVSAAPQPASQFLCKLAPELRNIIYAYVFLEDGDSKVHYQLLSTCRLIFEEARYFPLAVNWHTLKIHTHYRSINAYQLRFFFSNEPYDEWWLGTGQVILQFMQRYDAKQKPFLKHLNIVGELAWFEKEAVEHLTPLKEVVRNAKRIKLSISIWTPLDLRGCACQVLEDQKFPGLSKLLAMFSDAEEILCEYELATGKKVEVRELRTCPLGIQH